MKKVLRKSPDSLTPRSRLYNEVTEVRRGQTFRRLTSVRNQKGEDHGSTVREIVTEFATEDQSERFELQLYENYKFEETSVGLDIRSQFFCKAQYREGVSLDLTDSLSVDTRDETTKVKGTLEGLLRTFS